MSNQNDVEREIEEATEQQRQEEARRQQELEAEAEQIRANRAGGKVQ